MKIQIETIDDEASEQLRDLRQWLNDDEDLRPLQFTLVTAQRTSDEMTGGIPAVIEAAFINKDLLVAFTSAVGGWLASRASTRRTRIRVRKGEREVEIDTAKVRDSDQIVRQIWQDLGEDV